MSADLAVLAADPTSLDVYDDPGKQIELACQRANAWLKAGIDVRIETIVETKAQAAALAAFAIQKQLGKDAELAALEVQRRAERGVGLAIRRGQEAGAIAKRGDIGSEIRPGHAGGGIPGSRRGDDLVSPADFYSNNEERVDSYALARAGDDAFDAAIEEAKTEGNLSRANVIRKVKGEKNAVLTTTQKLDRIRELADKAWTSSQIARELGHGEEWVRRLARDNGIEIRADKLIGRTRRIDSAKTAAEIVATVAGLDLPMRLVNFTELDPAQAAEWADSLTESIRALNRFAKQMKETAQ